MAFGFLGSLGGSLLTGAKAVGKGLSTGVKNIGSGLSKGGQTFSAKLIDTSSPISSGIDDFVQGKTPSSGIFADTITGKADTGSVLTKEIDNYVKAPTESKDKTRLAEALNETSKKLMQPTELIIEPSMVDYSEYIYNNPYIQRMRGY